MRLIALLHTSGKVELFTDAYQANCEAVARPGSALAELTGDFKPVPVLSLEEWKEAHAGEGCEAPKKAPKAPAPKKSKAAPPAEEE